jgi:hypothetical protein
MGHLGVGQQFVLGKQILKYQEISTEIRSGNFAHN